MIFSTKDVQRALNEHGYKLKIDGIAGSKTEKALLDFQKRNGLYADGVVGNLTASVLFEEPAEFKNIARRLKFKKLACDPYGKSVGITYLREDVVEGFKRIREKLQSNGALLTSSGGRRLLSASTGKNRSQTSLHYLGIAHDLQVWSGMVDPHKDPYVIEKAGDRNWRVYARCEKNAEVDKVKAYTYDHQEIEVAGKFISVTDLMANEGWHPIRARKSFFSRKNKLGAEWWHFQCEDVLTPGARFGDELLKSFSLNKLRTYSVWNHRNVEWKRNWW